MATKSFLNESELIEAQSVLKAPEHLPDGNEKRGFSLGAHQFSLWLGEKLLSRLSQHSDWVRAEPVILGSWARDELCPKSDIDVIFLGPEDIVLRLVQELSKQGLKLRYRVPENLQDWTVGVEPFDVLALYSALPLSKLAAENLAIQIEKIKARSAMFRRDLLRAMKQERKVRTDRYDSISSFLEPNLKYGPGGLRDLEQALITRQVFPERFDSDSKEHAFVVLQYYKAFFLTVRQRLHLATGSTDVLTAPEQKPISDWFGFKDSKEFMREIQKGLSRVSFYADWVVAQASSSSKKIQEVESRKLNSVGSLFTALESDPSILMQNKVRGVSDQIFANAEKLSAGQRSSLNRLLGRRLTHIIDPAMPEDSMIAVFRSRLIDHCIPEFRNIVGYVQHDQYHRFSVDAHLLQVLRELKRLRRLPKRAGRLATRVRSLSSRQWEILSFACLFHDLAKGKGGDHAEKGVELANRELARLGKSEFIIREVCWIVEEHLSISQAAFRENPQSSRTWRKLAERGVQGERIGLLTLFTVVDILGTNPDAWTPWKERLLFDLANQLEQPETDSLFELGEKLKLLKTKDGIDRGERLVETLDPFLVKSIPAKTLVEDFRLLFEEQGVEKVDLAPKVVMRRGGNQMWIRFHCAYDKSGLFLSFVRKLAFCGMSIRHASILSDAELGVYDWFEVKTTKSAQQIQKMLMAPTQIRDEKVLQVRFDQIEAVLSGNKEWVVSFRGRDQSGALTAAAQVLFEVGAEIRWAKVHTWGRQIDDVFGIAPMAMLPKVLIEELLKRLGPENLQLAKSVNEAQKL